ncbi:MAG: hypothetical protein JST80_00835 [Bdellovibrionales bacterium]|nr:hypothetical protein [Bdellovibrionales bacterium]
MDTKYAPVIVAPLLTLVLAAIGFFGIYQLITPTVDPFAAIKGIAIFTSIVNPLLFSKIFKTDLKTPMTVWIFLTALAIGIAPNAFEGNPNIALAAHFIAYQFSASSLSAIHAVVLRKEGKTK